MMALDNYFPFPYHQPSWDWDTHTFGVGDLHEPLMPWGCTMDSALSSQTSTGYLQDAVAEWSDRCKRRRLASSACHDSTTTASEELQDLLEGFWYSNCCGDPLHDLNYMIQDNIVSPDDSSNVMLKAKTQVTGLQLPQEPLSSSTSCEEPQFSNEVNGKDPHRSRDPKPCTSKVKALTLKECESERSQSKKTMVKTSVAYPFDVVKPGGLDGDVTLNDINARILMRPRRSVSHPVGEYAQGPGVSSEGPGLSGKAVDYSLTYVQFELEDILLLRFAFHKKMEWSSMHVTFKW